ncbi:DUF6385 domain-containing protein [Paenibacillus sp. BR2-3]|uniref:DUF6385 domain-containing protein n=1 Tax=Paenibacillus sp. BR2-3 TaxID=3048494 RepID=UPI0039777DC7
MRVFTETSADFIASVTNLTAACLLVNSVTTNLTSACLLVQATQATAGCLLSQVSQPVAASLLSQVSQATAASLLAQVSQPVAASLLSQVSQATAASLLAQVSQPVAASLLSQVSNATAACLVVLLGDLGTSDTAPVSHTIASATLTPSVTRSVITLSQYAISVSNSCETGLVIQLQLSPDNVNWTNDSGTRLIAASTAGILAPSKFTKYARIQYAAQTAACTVTFNEFFQGQV